MRLTNYPTIKIIQTLTKVELKEFSLFICSPYHNQNKKLLELFTEIVKYCPDFNDKDFTKKNIYSALYGEKVFNDNTIRSILSDLNLLLEKFVELKYFQRRNNGCMLISALAERGLDELSYGCINNHTASNKKFDPEYLHDESEIQIQKINYLISCKKIKTKRSLEKIDTEINKLMHIEFSNYYFRMITHFTNLFTLYSNYNIEIKRKPVYDIILFLADSFSDKGSKDDYLLLYKYLLNSYLDLLEVKISVKNFQHYLKLLSRHSLEMTHDELSHHLHKQMSFIILKLKKDNDILFFDNELFRINNFILRNKLYINSTNKYLSPDLYISILMHSVKIEKIEWASDFIEKYNSSLKEEYRKILKIFSESYLEFFKGNIKQSQSLMDEFQAHYNKSLIAYNQLKQYVIELQLLIHFENRNYFEAGKIIKSYDLYVRRNKIISEEKKEMKLIFLKRLNQIFLLIENNHLYDLANLFDKIINDKEFFYKRWLMNKLEKIIAIRKSA
ncbi:MAG: hypothetical protein WAT71_00650 [Ignavibacteria bacterium]